MKRTLAMLGATALFLVALPSRAITLSIEPASQEVTAGATVSAYLVISGLGDGSAPSLGAFDVDVGFDSTILGLSSVVFGDPVLGDQLDLSGSGFSISGWSPGAGTVNLFEISFEDPGDLNDFQAASFALATLTFDSLAAGTSGLDITVNALGDASGDELLVDGISNGSITVKSSTPAIPEPSTLPLLGIGMLGMIALAIRRGSRAAGV